MLLKTCRALAVLMLLALHSVGQAPAPACSLLGQTPQSAFPICTSDTFVQSTVPICTNHRIPVPGCQGPESYQDKNPYWYQFTCYQTGTLGFLITPNNNADDYDWQIFDITAITDLNEVYSNAALFVIGNWSGSSGLTGASAAGTHIVECASDPKDNENTFSPMPVLQVGHTYLLMVSHFSDSQSGYKLSFGGGTAVIKNPLSPEMLNLQTSCDATQLRLKLNMRMRCATLATDGSDFKLSSGAATIVGASSVDCSSKFDMDSVIITLSNPLPPGTYSLITKKGSDDNTLLDPCDRQLPENRSISFTIKPLQPTPLDSIVPVACSPRQLTLIFKKGIRCSSIAANGSDFTVTGPSAITVKSAGADCGTTGLSSSVTVQLTGPIVKGGVYQLSLKRGNDNNSIFDECGQETPPSIIPFRVADTVSAAFTYSTVLGCKADTLLFAHNGANGVNQWFWLLDMAGASNAQSGKAVYTDFADKHITLKVSNGICSDSTVQTIALGNFLKAAFSTTDLLCPEDGAAFENNSKGKIIHYNWSFGDGSNSILQTPPPQHYNSGGAEKTYTVLLVVENDLHCMDSASARIKVLRTCYIAVPNAFTPNGDGKDDFLYPLNAIKADNLVFNVYNRLGQLVFHTTNWLQKWDGNIGGRPQSSGVYVWTLAYTQHDTGKKVFLKGTTVLIR